MSARIVVGVDGSASAVRAAWWAAAEAARRRVPLMLVHAYTAPIRGYREIVLTGHEVREAIEHQGMLWLAEAAAAVRAVVSDVETSLLVGTPAGALISESRRAGLVVGSQGLGGFSGLPAGSVAVAVSAHGGCPVVVVRGSGQEDGPVVVGVDGSPASEEAVGFAFEEASLRGAPLTAVIAWNDYLAGGGTYGARFTGDWSQVQEERRLLLAERLAGRQEKYPDVPVDRVVVRDRPVRALLRAAEDAQVLVVGSRGHGGFTGLLLGSTSQSLVYHARCSLVVVRPSRTKR